MSTTQAIDDDNEVKVPRKEMLKFQNGGNIDNSIPSEAQDELTLSVDCKDDIKTTLVPGPIYDSEGIVLSAASSVAIAEKKISQDLDIYSLLGLSEEEICQVETNSEGPNKQTSDEPSPQPQTSPENVSLDVEEKSPSEHLLSVVNKTMVDKTGRSDSPVISVDKDTSDFSVLPPFSEEQTAVDHNAHSSHDHHKPEQTAMEREQGIVMRNARYVNAHKKRMELAAKKRKPRVKKLPAAADYKAILLENEKIRLQQEHVRGAPDEEDVSLTNHGHVDRSRDKHMVKEPSRPSRQDISAGKILHPKPHPPPRQQKRVGNNKHFKQINTTSATGSLKETLCGEIQVKKHEDDEQNRFEMLVVVHDEEPLERADKDRGANFSGADSGNRSHVPASASKHNDVRHSDNHPIDSRQETENLNPVTHHYRLLRSAQQRNDQMISEMNKMAAEMNTTEPSDASTNMSLELEALNTIQNTLSSALNLCDHSLLHSHLCTSSTEPELPVGCVVPPMRYEESLLEEKRQLLLNWQQEERKRKLNEEVSAIERQLAEKVQQEEEELLQVRLREKRAELLSIVEELRQQELQRLQDQREQEARDQERLQRKREREEAIAERKLINNRINAFLECQEETLRRVKAAQGPQPGTGQQNYAPLPAVPEEREEEMTAFKPHAPLKPRNRESPRSLLKGRERKATTSSYHDRDDDRQMEMHSRGEYFDSDEVERRKERNEFYRVQNEQRDRMKQQELRDIQDRLNPDNQYMGGGRDLVKASSSGRKNASKKVKPHADLSSILSRNRKLRQQASSGGMKRRSLKDKSVSGGGGVRKMKGKQEQPEHQQQQQQQQQQQYMFLLQQQQQLLQSQWQRNISQHEHHNPHPQLLPDTSRTQRSDPFNLFAQQLSQSPPQYQQQQPPLLSQGPHVNVPSHERLSGEIKGMPAGLRTFNQANKAESAMTSPPDHLNNSPVSLTLPDISEKNHIDSVLSQPPRVEGIAENNEQVTSLAARRQTSPSDSDKQAKVFSARPKNSAGGAVGGVVSFSSGPTHEKEEEIDLTTPTVSLHAPTTFTSEAILERLDEHGLSDSSNYTPLMAHPNIESSSRIDVGREPEKREGGNERGSGEEVVDALVNFVASPPTVVQPVHDSLSRTVPFILKDVMSVSESMSNNTTSDHDTGTSVATGGLSSVDATYEKDEEAYLPNPAPSALSLPASISLTLETRQKKSKQLSGAAFALEGASDTCGEPLSKDMETGLPSDPRVERGDKKKGDAAPSSISVQSVYGGSGEVDNIVNRMTSQDISNALYRNMGKK